MCSSVYLFVLDSQVLPLVWAVSSNYKALKSHPCLKKLFIFSQNSTWPSLDGHDHSWAEMIAIQKRDNPPKLGYNLAVWRTRNANVNHYVTLLAFAIAERSREKIRQCIQELKIDPNMPLSATPDFSDSVNHLEYAFYRGIPYVYNRLVDLIC